MGRCAWFDLHASGSFGDDAADGLGGEPHLSQRAACGGGPKILAVTVVDQP